MALIEALESSRMSIQAEVDASRRPGERNRLGQYSTPPQLAEDILAFSKRLVGSEKARFLDPAFGTGSFYSALLKTYESHQIYSATGFEIDPAYGLPAQKLWRGSGLDLHLADFTMSVPPPVEEMANLIICNPPYVRHHHLSGETKERLQREVSQSLGIRLSGLAGLYCYFMCLSHRWLARDGVAGWLIPSEFMDVNYGKAVKEYLLQHVTLLRIHRFDPNDVQFDDALVSSAVVWFRSAPPTSDFEVEFTYGGSLLAPAIRQSVSVLELRGAGKWSVHPRRVAAGVQRVGAGPKLGDFFDIKRGIATGSNSFFILSTDEAQSRKLPAEFLKPVLPSPRYLEVDEVPGDREGFPVVERRLVLIDCNLPESDVESNYASLWAYLQEGVARGVSEAYLCRHRVPWYSQERRLAAPFLCTYMGRGLSRRTHPFRFILNHSSAIAANVYLLLYPKTRLARAMKDSPELVKSIWLLLKELTAESLIAEGRVYGGGLYKMEPKELANVPADQIEALLPAEGYEQLTLAFTHSSRA